MSFFERVKAYFSRDNFQKDPELVSFDELEPPKVAAPMPAPVTATVPTLPTTGSITSSVVAAPSQPLFADEPQSETKSWVMTPPNQKIEWPNWLEDETLSLIHI